MSDIPVKSVEWFDSLKNLPHEKLKNMGLGLWKTGHYLYPREWYDFIPEGYEVVDIFGDREPFKHGETDTDQRCGVLAYGFTTPDYVPEEAAMSDTTTITPEERARIREIAAKRNRLSFRVGIHDALDNLLTALEAAEASKAETEAENARLRKRLEAALDKIADIQDEWESEGVCHACGICAGIPYEWQPTADHCCRVTLDLWSNGEPLPWESAARRAVAGEGESS